MAGARSIQTAPAGASTVRRGRKILMEKQSLGIVLGRDEQGGDIAFDLAALPHLLIGGSTAMAFPNALHSRWLLKKIRA